MTRAADYRIGCGTKWRLVYVLHFIFTKLPIIMDANKTILIFVLVLVMCMGSAAVAMRKLVDADPAEIF